MKGPALLEFFENNWPTNKGAWFPGKGVLFRKSNPFVEFPDKSWLEVIIYGITGRIPSKESVQMITGLWNMSTSIPDPRIWNNRICALAGTTRSTGALALSASTAVSEATIYGGRPVLMSCNFLVSASSKVKGEEDLDVLITTYLKKHRSLPGFGRPVIGSDERIEPVVKLATRLGFDQGQYINMVWRVEKILQKKRLRMQPNIGAVYSAVMMDMGYSPWETYYIAIIIFTGGMLPCYIDAKEKKEGTFFPMACNLIDYKGSEKRKKI